MSNTSMLTGDTQNATVTDDDIQIVRASLGEPPGAQARIGLIALGTGLTGEEEMHAMLPAGARVLTTRVRNQNHISLQSLAEIETEMVRAASTLLPGGELDVVVYACTSGTVAMGEQTVVDRIREVKPGVAVTTPFTGAVAALQTLNLKRIALVTPYTRELTAAVRDELVMRGVEIVRTLALGLDQDSDMCRVTPASIVELAVDADSDAAEGVFVSCTALETSSIIEEIERRIGKPVVTSNQALVWHALRLAGYDDAIDGLGILMRTP